MFVPYTRDSKLQRKFSSLEERLGYKGRMKYIESLGQSVQDILVRKDPWQGRGVGA